MLNSRTPTIVLRVLSPQPANLGYSSFLMTSVFLSGSYVHKSSFSTVVVEASGCYLNLELRGSELSIMLGQPSATVITPKYQVYRALMYLQ